MTTWTKKMCFFYAAVSIKEYTKYQNQQTNKNLSTSEYIHASLYIHVAIKADKAILYSCERACVRTVSCKQAVSVQTYCWSCWNELS